MIQCQWLGFSQKVNATKVLEKNFVIDMDYKCLLCKLTKQKVMVVGVTIKIHIFWRSD